MEALLPAVVLLACPVGMGLMMWFMARNSRPKSSDSARPAPAADASDHPRSLELLREEHRRLGDEIERLQAPASERPEPAERR